MEAMLHLLGKVRVQEFSDIGDVTEVKRVCIRLSVAIFLGALLSTLFSLGILALVRRLMRLSKK